MIHWLITIFGMSTLKRGEDEQRWRENGKTSKGLII